MTGPEATGRGGMTEDRAGRIIPGRAPHHRGSSSDHLASADQAVRRGQ
ncbi:MAG: hypothetical protein H7Z41_16080 [Cytophagales bacterium]|nr:hypothetical protein [Armatimonadota bacterium]